MSFLSAQAAFTSCLVIDEEVTRRSSQIGIVQASHVEGREFKIVAKDLQKLYLAWRSTLLG